MTSNILFSCPTEINPEICKNCHCAFLYSFSSTILFAPLLIARKKNPARIDLNLYQEMSLRYKRILIRKSSTFRQLATNQSPHVCL